MFQDLRYALRTLRKSPGFTCAALFTLALGIGANTAIYSVVDAVLLHPVPFPDADRLVVLYQKTPHSDKNSVSYPNLLDWQGSTKAFEAIAGWRSDLFTLNGRGEPESLIGMMVSAEFFPVLKVQPLIGRTFTSDEDRAGAAPVVLLGEDFWRRRFAADRTLIGKAVTLNSRDYTVIGVVPARVRLDRANNTFFNDVFVPLGQYDADPLFHDRGVGNGTVGLGRLRPGITLSQAQAEMDGVMRTLAAEYPNENALTGANLIAFADLVAADLRPTLLALAAAVGFVLLIACTNVANLALARSTGRRQEFGVRLALGAPRGRLIRQQLTESALIAIGGGAIGVFVAAWATAAALAVLPSALPAISRVEMNPRVLLFTLGVSLFSGLLFGLVPALKAAALNLNDTLKHAGRGTVRSPYRAQHLFVVMEIALTLVLLVGAGLMMRSLQKLWTVDPGFNPDGVMTFYTGISRERAATTDRIRAGLSEIAEKLSSLPGVESASIQIGGLPFRGNTTVGFLTEQDADTSRVREMRTANFYAVSPGHFTTMGIPLLRGRAFTRADRSNGPLVVIIDEELARTAFAGQEPIGKHIRFQFFDDKAAEIVGIARHVRHSGLDTEASVKDGPQVYLPVAQLPDVILSLAVNGITGVVRSKMPPADLMRVIRKELGALDNGQAVHSEELMTDAIAASLAGRRFSLTVLGAFAATALVLSIVGIYSVVSYFIGRRTNEIGVRMALGATPGHIFYGVLAEGGKLAAAGLALGIAGAALLTRLMKSLLFGISSTDAVTFIFAAILLFALMLVACYLPARRAVRIDPMAALRFE